MIRLYELQGLAPNVLVEGFSSYKASLSVSSNTMITNWNVSSPYFSGGNFNATTGFYTAPVTGAYQTQATISYTAGTITTQLGANNPTFIIQRTSPTTEDLVTGQFPILDINIALLITLRTLLSGSTITLAGTVQLTQGDTLGLFYNADSLTLALSLQNVIWTTYPLGWTLQQ